MDVHFEFTGSEPAYRQIVRHIETGVRSGELLPGTRLPAERELSKQLNINRSTVSVAYDELRAKGLIRSVRGSGTRVSEDAWGLDFRIPDWAGYMAQGVFQPTLPMVRRIWEENRKFGNINLARGEMSAELWPAKQLQALISRLTSHHMALGYGDPRGEESLRAAIAVHLRSQYGLHVPADQILVTAGSQQGLLLVTQSLLRPGDAVALEKPSYAYSLALFASAGIRMFPLSVDEGGLAPDELIAMHRRHKIRMVFITPTYQNPTGTTLSSDRRKNLIDICAQLRIPIVEDDAYGTLTLQGGPRPPQPLAAMSGAGQQVVYLGTLSKTFVPGLRVGWMTGPKSVIERIAGIREQMDFGISGITQAIAQRVLTTGMWEQNVERLGAALSKRRDIMVDAAQKYFGEELAFAVPQGGYHIWGKFRRPLPDKVLLETALRYGVVVVPGSVYGEEPGYVRLTYASSSESEIEEGVRRLHAALQAVAGETKSASLQERDEPIR